MAKSSNKKRLIKKNSSILLVSGVILVAIGFFLIVNYFKPNGENKVKALFEYDIDRKIDYDVKLLPNYYYDEVTLSKDKIYASKSIDYINLDLLYGFKSSKSAKVKYTYKVIGEIVGKAKDVTNKNNEIWNKKFILNKESEVNSITSQAFLVDRKVKINYSKYYNLVSGYEKTYNVDLDAYLKVTLYIDYDLQLPKEKDFKEFNDAVEVQIPLTNNVTEVINKTDVRTNKKFKDNTLIKETKKSNITILILGVGFEMVGAALMLVSIEKHQLSKKAKYQRNLDSILKEYSDIIVTVTNKPNIKDLRPLNLSSIDDLVDAAEQNNSNIIHYERIKNEASTLIVISDGYVYTYDITSDDLK